MKRTLASLILSVSMLSLCPDASPARTASPDSPQKSAATLALEKKRDELTPHLVQASPHVWVSVGEDVANVGMIVGKDGIVIIDTGQSTECAAATLKKFREIAPADKYPIKTVVYTHGHGDHTGGSSVFCSEGEKPEVWARDNFGSELVPFQDSGLTPLFTMRGAMQGGFQLPPEKRISNGIAPVRYPSTGGASFSGKTGAVPPDHFLKGDSMTIRAAGLELSLFATPGETDDALSVWFPAEKVLFCGDNLYRSFPNLYPVRGVGNRDVPAWIDSLNRMLALDADALVPGHTDPFIGRNEVRTVITNYRDAVRHVFDKTIEGMNAGKTPDELAAEIRLPEHLAGLDYLGEYYGNVAWAVRQIFGQYVGWFDGNPLHLYTNFTTRDEAARTAALAGGEEALLKNARAALRNNDPAWAARLADHLLALRPDDAQILELKADALDALGETMLTATGRNYTLSVAQNLRQKATQR